MMILGFVITGTGTNESDDGQVITDTGLLEKFPFYTSWRVSVSVC